MKINELLLNESSTSIMYHVCKADRVGTILDKGLRPREGYVYLWDNLDNAFWFMNLHQEDGKQMCLLQVNVKQLNLQKDPETEDMSHWGSIFNQNEFGGGYMYPGTIPPERIKLLNK